MLQTPSLVHTQCPLNISLATDPLATLSLVEMGEISVATEAIQ